MSDFGGRGSVTLKNRGRSKKTEGQTRLKSKGGSLAVGTYFQRGSAPHPPGSGSGYCGLESHEFMYVFFNQVADPLALV